MTSPLIFPKIVAVMRDISAIGKDQKAHTYKFRGVDDVYNELHSHLARHGVFSVPTVISDKSEERTSSKGGVLIYRVLHIQYTFYAEDGSSIEGSVIGEGMDSGDKASNKAMSVAHKYFFLQVFCIPTADLKDPEIEDHQLKVKNVKPPIQEAPATEPPAGFSSSTPFDKKQFAHTDFLRKALAKRNIPESFDKLIAIHLDGQFFTIDNLSKAIAMCRRDAVAADH